VPLHRRQAWGGTYMYHFLFKNVAEQQIEQYVAWRNEKHQYASTSKTERRWIEDFIFVCNIKDLTRADRDHIRTYLTHVKDNYGTTHSYRTALKALGCIYAHMHAQQIPCISRPIIYEVSNNIWHSKER
jgi:site-specific recombinase XerD